MSENEKSEILENTGTVNPEKNVLETGGASGDKADEVTSEPAGNASSESSSMDGNSGGKSNENDVAAEPASEQTSTELVKTDTAASIEISEPVKNDLATTDNGNNGSGQNEDRKKKFIIFGIIGAAVILLVVLLIILLGGKKEEKPEESAIIPVTPTVTPTPTPLPTSTHVPTATPTPTAIVEAEPTPSPIPDIVLYHEELGETQSYINGNWVQKEIANQRPYAIMFNNIAVANPQSGVGDADILYEILVEGNITRLMGVFENLTDESSCKDRIGSVRSARHYYASIASEYDAIFIHYGETTYATKKIKALNLDHLEGLYAEGSTVYYRDKNIKSPHNAFASLAGIHKAIENKKIRTDHEEGYVPQHFTFAYSEGGQNSIDRTLGITVTPEGVTGSNSGETGMSPASTVSANETVTGIYSLSADSTVNGITEEQGTENGPVEENGEVISASLVRLPFSSYAQPYLTYDEETKLYKRYQFGGEHIDYNTKEQLTFKNIIIQVVQESNRDKNGYQDIEGYSDKTGHHSRVSGEGYYICEGQCIKIKWEKEEKLFECNYYTLDGEKLVMRPGKTFIAVFPNFREDKIEIQ